MLPGRGARAREGTRNDDPSCHIGATPAPFGPVTCDTVGPGGPHGCRREPVVGTPGESSYHGRMPSPQPNESGAGPWQATDPAAPAPVRAREDIDPRGRSRDRSWPPQPPPLPSPVIDNHCHLDFADGDQQLTVGDHIERAAAVGVEALITIGSDLEATRWTAELLASPNCPPQLRGGVAVHPNEAALHARGSGHDGTEMIGRSEERRVGKERRCRGALSLDRVEVALARGSHRA